MNNDHEETMHEPTKEKESLSHPSLSLSPLPPSHNYSNWQHISIDRIELVDGDRVTKEKPIRRQFENQPNDDQDERSPTKILDE